MSKVQLIKDLDFVRTLYSQNRITDYTRRFHIQNVSPVRIANLIYTAYLTIVESRGRNFTLTEELENNIVKVAENLISRKSKSGILFTGTCGNGKTTLMLAIRETIFYLYMSSPSIPKSINLANGIPFIHAKKIIDGEERISYADVLLIDDFGEEPTEYFRYGNVCTPVIDLLENRYCRDKFTILSTNLSGELILNKYGKRISDRLEEMMEIVSFQDTSFRH